MYMLEEENLARDTYLTLYEVCDLMKFFIIASAEQKHMDALLKLLKKYNPPDPAANTAIGEFTNSTLQNLYNTLIAMGKQSSLNALKVGGIIEKADMRDINAAIERLQKEDIDLVYESLVCGSRNHLRSYAENIVTATGVSYAAQVIIQAEVDQIIQTPMERCGR
jgi:hypothetical protein